MKKMVVGLGNYGSDFDGTRHNIGFEILDALAKKPWVESDSCMISYTDTDILLIKPMSGMNICGAEVEHARSCFQIPIEDVIVIHDEMDFKPGQIKIKFNGGDGKHNGLKTLIQHMGSNFTRIRVGIGKPKNEKGIDFVLSQFPKHERKLMDNAIIDAIAAVNMITKENLQSAMAFFNQKKDK